MSVLVLILFQQMLLIQMEAWFYSFIQSAKDRNMQSSGKTYITTSCRFPSGNEIQHTFMNIKSKLLLFS